MHAPEPRLRRFIHAWHVDAHEIARVRNLIAREHRKFCLRLYQAYFHNWKLRTGVLPLKYASLPRFLSIVPLHVSLLLYFFVIQFTPAFCDPGFHFRTYPCLSFMPYSHTLLSPIAFS